MIMKRNNTFLYQINLLKVTQEKNNRLISKKKKEEEEQSATGRLNAMEDIKSPETGFTSDQNGSK